MICPNCGKESSLLPVQKDHVVRYRGREFKTIIYGHRCMNCKESFMDPLDHSFDEKLDNFIIRVNKETSDYTCATCLNESTCPYRWDEYNTNGDCLCSK